MKKIKAITISERMHKRLTKYCRERGLKVGATADAMILYSLQVMPKEIPFKSSSYFMNKKEGAKDAC